jgi:hypothetical protein
MTLGLWKEIELILKYFQDQHVNLKVCDQLTCLLMPLKSLEMFQFVVHLFKFEFLFPSTFHFVST